MTRTLTAAKRFITFGIFLAAKYFKKPLPQLLLSHVIGKNNTMGLMGNADTIYTKASNNFHFNL